MKKIVYAACGCDGLFEELVVIDSNQVIVELLDEDEEFYICKFVDNGVEDEFYYLDKKII